MSGPPVSGRSRLKLFVDRNCTTDLTAEGFVQKGLVFRHRKSSDQTLVVEFRTERQASRLERDLVFLVEVAVIPEEFLLFTCAELDREPPSAPDARYGMWRSWAVPREIQLDEDGSILWPTQGWRLNDEVDESDLANRLLAALESKVEFMNRLADTDFWLALVDGWHEEVDYPSLWGPRAQIMLLLPGGDSKQLDDAIAGAMAVGDQAVVDWARKRLREGHT